MLIKLESRGPVFYRQRRVGLRRRSVRALEAAHDGPGRGDHGRRHLRARGRPAHHAHRPAAAPLLARRAAQPRQRAQGRDGDRRARARPSRSRSTATPTASGAGSRSSPGSPAGPRSTAARHCRGRSGSSSTSGTWSTARCASTCASSAARRACSPPATGSTRTTSGRAGESAHAQRAPAGRAAVGVLVRLDHDRVAVGRPEGGHERRARSGRGGRARPCCPPS